MWPNTWVKGGISKTRGSRLPELTRPATLDEKVHRRFQIAPAKRAEVAVGPLLLHQSISREQPVNRKEPGEKLALRRSPNSPNGHGDRQSEDPRN